MHKSAEVRVVIRHIIQALSQRSRRSQSSRLVLCPPPPATHNSRAACVCVRVRVCVLFACQLVPVCSLWALTADPPTPTASSWALHPAADGHVTPSHTVVFELGSYWLVRSRAQ
jgi:hypothetical protein